MARVAVFIDGSNLLGQVEACFLSYPALEPLIKFLRRGDDLAYAGFYSAPQIREPFRSQWNRFQSANRHLSGLTFFMGYRDNNNREKAIDVALAVDLIDRCHRRDFDRAVVVGGDGDHPYALNVARGLCNRLEVWLMPNQPSGALRASGFNVKHFEIATLCALGVCERSRFGSVPAIHAAPAGSPAVAIRLRGAFGDPAEA
jgi:uncharacterized LabA/DUF88 family protein